MGARGRSWSYGRKVHTSDPDRRPGDDWSLRDLYDLVPDAYELDLLEEARGPAPTHVDLDLEEMRRAAISGLGYDLPAGADDPTEPLSQTQAQFMIERLLGGVVVDETRS